MGCCRGEMVWDECRSHLGVRGWARMMARRGGLRGVRLGSPGPETGVNQGTERQVRPAFSRAFPIPVSVVTPFMSLVWSHPKILLTPGLLPLNPLSPDDPASIPVGHPGLPAGSSLPPSLT